MRLIGSRYLIYLFLRRRDPRITIRQEPNSIVLNSDWHEIFGGLNSRTLQFFQSTTALLDLY